MLIYMEPPLQKKIDAFNYSLNPGIMLLGTAETIDDNTDFETIDSRLKFFRKQKLLNSI
jgi:chemotaxis methyl-accepting protein methylase